MYGTGWLGWSAEQTLDTPLSQLFLALEGKVECLKKTNPFGSSGEPVQKTTSPEARAKLDRLAIARLEMRNKNV